MSRFKLEDVNRELARLKDRSKKIEAWRRAYASAPERDQHEMHAIAFAEQIATETGDDWIVDPGYLNPQPRRDAAGNVYPVLAIRGTYYYRGYQFGVIADQAGVVWFYWLEVRDEHGNRPIQMRSEAYTSAFEAFKAALAHALAEIDELRGRATAEN